MLSDDAYSAHIIRLGTLHRAKSTQPTAAMRGREEEGLPIIFIIIIVPSITHHEDLFSTGSSKGRETAVVTNCMLFEQVRKSVVRVSEGGMESDIDREIDDDM